MPNIRRKERGKTQPVRFDVPSEPEVKEAKCQGQGQDQGHDQGQEDNPDGSTKKRARHTRSHSTPNLPALDEALSASQNNGAEKVKVLALSFSALRRFWPFSDFRQMSLSFYHSDRETTLPFCTTHSLCSNAETDQLTFTG